MASNETFLNTSTLSVSVEGGSFAAWGGPIAPNQLSAAIAAYRTLAHQYIQLLDITSNIAGPSLVPTGNPAVHVDRAKALVTWNFTANPAVPAEMVGWNPSLDPIDSPWKDISSRAASAPSVFLDRKIFGPFTGPFVSGSPSVMMQHGVLSGAVIPFPNTYSDNVLNPRVKAVDDVKMQIFTGINGQANGVCTVREFVADIARPLLEAYQTVLEKLYGRLKSSTPADAEQQSSLWTALHIVTPDATRRMYEKLEVLRDSQGRPQFAPACRSHALRDLLVGGVVDVMFSIPHSPKTMNQ